MTYEANSSRSARGFSRFVRRAAASAARAPWLRRIRGALGMGLLWGAGWAVVGGGLMEVFIDPHGRILDMWPQVLAVVGFLGGVIFSAMLGIVGGHRSFDEFSFREFAALGAVAGLLQGVFAIAIVGAPALFVGVTTLGSAVAAAGSLAVARMAGTRRLTAPRG